MLTHVTNAYHLSIRGKTYSYIAISSISLQHKVQVQWIVPVGLYSKVVAA